MLIDSNVFIDILRGDQELNAHIRTFNGYLSSVSYIELIQGAERSKKEIRIIEGLVSQYPIIHISESISQKAVALIEEYAPSHGLQLADSLIAATALLNQMPLFTFNRKDFHYIEGINL